MKVSSKIRAVKLCRVVLSLNSYVGYKLIEHWLEDQINKLEYSDKVFVRQDILAKLKTFLI